MIEKISMFDDKAKDVVTKNNYVANKLPLGLILERNEKEEVCKDFEISGADGNADIILTDERFSNNHEKVLTFLLASYVKKLGSLTEKEINEEVIKDLYDVDRDYLFTKLRDITFGNEEPIKAAITCKCGNRIEIDGFDLGRLYVGKLQSNKDLFNYKIIKKEIGDFYFRETKCNFFSFQLPTGRILEKIAHLTHSNFGLWKTALIKECLLQIGDFVQPFLDDEITKMPSLIRKKIYTAISETGLGLHKKGDAMCPKCNNINRDARIEFENFFPL